MKRTIVYTGDAAWSRTAYLTIEDDIVDAIVFLQIVDFINNRLRGTRSKPLIHSIAEIALKDFFITQAPKPWSKAEVVEAFNSALALTSR